MHSHRACESFRRANALAACISAATIAVVYSSFDPLPAGDSVQVGNDFVASAEFVLNDEPVPLPPNLIEHQLPLSPAPLPAAPDELAAPDEAVAASAAGRPAVAAPPVSDGIFLTNLEAVQFSLYLLRDGETRLQETPWYSAVFSKQERIQGDLQESQTIDMKVRQSPNFSVYMKWRNGDTGRQALYGDHYEDGQMVVKLGGLKGRLLPAIKLDPLGERAQAESRYPITQAGLLGMQRQIIHHRQGDVERGYGVRCRRLPDQQFDECACLCFEFIYDSPEISPVYRKSIILIDARRHISLLTRSYTWAKDTVGISEDQLDELTLIENYSYTSINLGAELVAEDFSRDNPKYRM